MRAVVYRRANFEPIVAVDIDDSEVEVLRAGDPIAIAVPVRTKQLHGRFAYRRVPIYAEFVMIGMRRGFSRVEGIMLFPLNGDDVPLLHQAFPWDQGSIKVISTGTGWISRWSGPLSAVKLADLTMIEDCERRESRLSGWEVWFLDWIRHRLEGGKPLTERQTETLEKIWERATALG